MTGEGKHIATAELRTSLEQWFGTQVGYRTILLKVELYFVIG